MLFSPPTIPIYLFLLAKGHPEKTIVFQSFTVIANMLLFISLYPFIGLYSILAANALECLGSFYLGYIINTNIKELLIEFLGSLRSEDMQYYWGYIYVLAGQDILSLILIWHYPTIFAYY